MTAAQKAKLSADAKTAKLAARKARRARRTTTKSSSVTVRPEVERAIAEVEAILARLRQEAKLPVLVTELPEGESVRRVAAPSKTTRRPKAAPNGTKSRSNANALKGKVSRPRDPQTGHFVSLA
jgi:hypothetical protein